MLDVSFETIAGWRAQFSIEPSMGPVFLVNPANKNLFLALNSEYIREGLQADLLSRFAIYETMSGPVAPQLNVMRVS